MLRSVCSFVIRAASLSAFSWARLRRSSRFILSAIASMIGPQVRMYAFANSVRVGFVHLLMPLSSAMSGRLLKGGR